MKQLGEVLAPKYAPQTRLISNLTAIQDLDLRLIEEGATQRASYPATASRATPIPVRFHHTR
jgi:hypothetical protein